MERTGVRERVEALASWWRTTRPARALARFGAVGGGVLTGGIAYAALFSAFAALTIGYTVFMAVLGGNDELRGRVLDALSSALPGLVDSDDGPGLLDPDQLRLTTGLSVAGLVAVVTLLVSAVSAVSALRTAVRAMFAARDRPGAVSGKLRELAGFVGIASAVLTSAVLGLALTSAVDRLAVLLGQPAAAGPVTYVLGVLVAFVVDAAAFVLVIRVLAGQAPPRRDLLGGAVIAGVGLGAIRLLGTSVVSGSVRTNPVLASFAVVVVLLLWVNLMARIVLLAAAWTADPPLSPAADPPVADPPRDDDATAGATARRGFRTRG